MARLESVAIGGYYPTPERLIPIIADLLKVDQDDNDERNLMDPCAGKGEAIVALSNLIGVRTHLFTCEMEKERYDELKRNIQKSISYASSTNALHGDAFQVDVSGRGISLLYLNPPYDTDPVHGRLEERFLERFTPSLVEGGILLFLVPFYALKASANTLAREYQDLKCFRFPDEEFEAYSQVVLVGRKTDATLPVPDPKVLARVLGWAESADKLPVLGKEKASYRIPAKTYYSSSNWSMRQMDLVGLLKKIRPWSHSTRSGQYARVPHILPEVPVEDLMFRTFNIATAPRPAHIAAGIASGLFNGRRVSPKTPGLPDLLVKGVFDREYVTIEEKYNKEGIVSSVVQVQQPKLVTTVLDLSTQTYSTLKLGTRTGTTEVPEMTIEDLLDHYGPSLMNVMAEQCPVTYDAKRDSAAVPLADMARKPYKAQANAAKAITKLLGGVQAKRQDRKGKAAILLGEIGSGKTSVALNVGRTIANRVLVMCPPHLLDSWRDETKTVLPEAEFRVLQTVSDVDDLESIPADRFVVAVVSRETAKLGHGWISVTGSCPKCGASLPPGDLAKKRARCEAHTLHLDNIYAQSAHNLAIRVAPSAPSNSWVEHILHGRFMHRYLSHATAQEGRAPWEGFDPAWVETLLEEVVAEASEMVSEPLLKLFGRLMIADYNQERIARAIQSFPAGSSYYLCDLARALLLLLPPESDLQTELKQAKVFGPTTWTYFGDSIKNVQEKGVDSPIGTIKWTDEVLTLDDRSPDSLELAVALLSSLTTLRGAQPDSVCGEPLFQAVAEPRRYPLSRYISKRVPDFFDLLVLDEGHEYATDGSAQERSAHRLTALGIPTILMTGSIMNGYAESLFSNMWALSPDFRAEFARTDRPRFIERYGYSKRILTDRDRETGDVIEFGSHTERVERSERQAGDAPGILPLFLFRHLLAISVTLHKADLAIDLPPCRQIKQLIEVEPELMDSFKQLQQELMTQIRKDQFKAGFAGKLFGALAELSSYLDRSTLDTGNQPDGSYEIHYPESIGGELVAKGKSFSASTLSNKEQWMLDTIRAELAEGRNVMVFTWHVCLLPRIARILSKELGEEVPILYADKVATGKRQEWINKNIVKKNRRIMVANPVAIQTGLNNLVHFSSQIWLENPACNPIIFRQGIGRVDRIGAKQETRIYVPIFAGTLQVQLYDLLLRKVAVAVATDGLDPESVLLAAGASDDGFLSGLSIGKQLWNLLNAN